MGKFTRSQWRRQKRTHLNCTWLTYTPPQNCFTQKNINRLSCYHPPNHSSSNHPSLNPSLPSCPWLEFPIFHPGPLNSQPLNKSIERIFNSLPYPSIPTWLCLHLNSFPESIMTASNINPACKHLATLTNGDRESESQVITMVGVGQDAGRTFHGDVQQAKYQVCEQNLPYLLPIVPAPPSSNHRAVSDTDITPTRLIAPFQSQPQHSLEPTAWRIH